ERRLDELTTSLQHPLHCLITNCALQTNDRMLATIRPKCCQVGPSRAGNYALLTLILLFCKGTHARSPIVGTMTTWFSAKRKLAFCTAHDSIQPMSCGSPRRAGQTHVVTPRARSSH